jgi:outer membrane receptor for ferrienterochelin and colicins
MYDNYKGNIMKTKMTILALLLVYIQVSFAQNKMNDFQQLPEVQITANRTESLLENTADVVQVVSRTEIERLNLNSTSEILEYVSGINIESGTGSGFNKRGVVSMNGFAPNYSLVLINGVRLLSDHVHSGQNIDLIPVEDIERIEIIKTAASAQYGSDALGGIVNIITKSPEEDASGTVYTEYGSYHSINTGAGISTKLNENIGMYSMIDYESSDGLPLLDSTSHRFDNTGYKSLNLTQRIEARFNKFHADAWVKFIKNEMEWARDVNNAAQSHLFIPAINLSYQFNDKLSIYSKNSYTEWVSEVSEEKNQLFHPEIWMNYQISDKNQAIFGADYKNHQFTRTSVDTKTQTAYGVFAQDNHQFGDKFVLSASLRADMVENQNIVITPKLSVLYNALDNLRFRLGYSHGYHAPNVQELYENAYGHGGTAYRFGNENLEAEHSKTAHLSAEFSPFPNLHIYSSAFYSQVDNMIIPVYEGPWEEDSSINVWRRQNILSAQVYGAEAGIRAVIFNNILLEGSYSYSDNMSDDESRQLPYNPGHAIAGRMTFKQNLGNNWSLQEYVSLKAVKGRTIWNWKPASGTDATNPDGLITALDDFQKLDAGIRIIYKNQHEFYFNTFNLLGQNYANLDDYLFVINGEPHFMAGLKFRF